MICLVRWTLTRWHNVGLSYIATEPIRRNQFTGALSSSNHQSFGRRRLGPFSGVGWEIIFPVEISTKILFLSPSLTTRYCDTSWIADMERVSEVLIWFSASHYPVWRMRCDRVTEQIPYTLYKLIFSLLFWPARNLSLLLLLLLIFCMLYDDPIKIIILLFINLSKATASADVDVDSCAIICIVLRRVILPSPV